MLVFILYLFVAMGLLMLIGLVAFYGIAVVLAPFINLYNAIKERNYKLLYAMLFFIVCISFFVWITSL